MTDQQRKFVLTEGSKYLIQSIGKRDELLITEGTFLGYTRIGSDEALCMEMEGKKGKLRILPVHMILAMDVISEAKPTTKKDARKGDSASEVPISYFG
jgi:hypothetical protein